jgi:hypothetical protein
VARFLAARDDKIVDLELLHGGFWSAAYGYRLDDREFALRIGRHRAWFEIDRDARVYNAPDLPVPEVLEIGDAFGGSYAISVRHHGRSTASSRGTASSIWRCTINAPCFLDSPRTRVLAHR